MAATNQIDAAEIEEPCYRIDVKGSYGWNPVIRRDGSLKILKFKTVRDAETIIKRFGLYDKNTRIIDEVRGRKVLKEDNLK